MDEYSHQLEGQEDYIMVSETTPAKLVTILTIV
jgi:hypothetical protein